MVTKVITEDLMDFSQPLQAVIPSLEGEVITVLARTTRPLTGRQIAGLTMSGSLSGVRLTLRRLESQGVVLAESAGRAVLYRANREHLLWEAVEELARRAESALATLKIRIADVFTASLNPEQLAETSVAMFGSVARGTSNAKSDIDLVVVYPDSLEPELGQTVVDTLVERVSLWTGNRCNVYVTTLTLLERLVTEQDPMIESWADDAQTFLGADLRLLLLVKPQSRVTRG